MLDARTRLTGAFTGSRRDDTPLSVPGQPPHRDPDETPPQRSARLVMEAAVYRDAVAVTRRALQPSLLAFLC